MTTVTASEAYTTLSSYQRRQMQVLASIKTEQAAAQKQHEAITTSLETLLHDMFPTVEDLPLTLMTESSRLKEGEGIERNFINLLETLQYNDKVNRRDFDYWISKHGSIEKLRSNKERIESEIASKNSEITAARNTHQSHTKDQISTSRKIQPLAGYTLATGIETSNDWAESHRKFSFWKQLTDKNWRDARTAIHAYQKNGGTDINQDEADLKDLNSKIKQEEGTISGRMEDVRRLNSELSDVSTNLVTLEKLERDYKGPAKIHAEICANFADYLQDENVAAFIGKNLPAAQANPLMEATLKFKNLRLVLDNLQTLRRSAENALEQLEKPVSDLEKVKRKKPYRALDIDLDKIGGNLDKFNSSVETALARSSSTRQTLSHFSTSNTSTYSSSSYQDDPLSFWRTMLMIQMMNDASANPDCHIDPQATEINTNTDTIDAAGTMPVISSDLGDLGTTQMIQMPSLTIEMPVIAVEVPAISIPTVDMSGFGGGGYSGGSDVSSVSCDTGGSCMISAHMNIPAIDSGVRKPRRNHGRARAFTI